MDRSERHEHERSAGSGVRAVPTVGAIVALAVLPGCVTGCVDGGGDDDTARDAAIYRSVIVDVVDGSEVELDEGEELPVLFIEAFGADEIPLPVQVDVVAGLVEEYEVRFIDQRDEAVEIDLPGSPVRPGSLFIGLGDIDVDGTAEVHSELYMRTDDVRGFSYTLMEAGDGVWRVVGRPITIEPEGLAPGS